VRPLALRHKILLAVSVPSLIALAGIAGYLLISLQGWAVDRWTKDHHAFVESLAGTIDADIARARELVRFSASLPAFAALPERDRIDLSINGIPEHADRPKRDALDWLRDNAGFSVLFVLTPEGDFYLCHPFAVQRTLSRYNLSDRPYFQQAVATRATVVSDSFVGADGVPAVAIDTPVLDDAGNIVAHVGGVLHLDRLAGMLRPERIAPFDIGLIVDRGGRIMAQTETALPPAVVAWLAETSAQASSSTAERAVTGIANLADETGREWLGFHATLDTGWHLLTLRDRDGLRAEILPQVQRTALFAAAFLSLLSITALVLARRFVQRWAHAEDALRASEETSRRERDLFAGGPVAVFIWRPEAGWPVDYVSRNVRGILGYTSDEMTAPGFHFADLIHPDDQARVGQEVTDYLASHRTQFEQSYRLRCKHGEYRWFYDFTMPERDADGELRRIRGYLFDQSEIRLAQARQRLSARVFESTSEGITITDIDGVIQAVNPAFTRITGYTEAEVRGKRSSVLRSGRHDQAFYQAMWQQLVGAGQWQGEIWNRRKNGEVYPEWITISAVHDDSGEVSHYVAVFTDITALRKAQEQAEWLAWHDPLTGLPNRALFMERLGQTLANAQRDGRYADVLILDLDRFKDINDARGIAIGDRLLGAVGERLRGALREGDSLARLTADEFAILLPRMYSDTEQAARQALSVAEKLRALISRPFELDGEAFRLGVSIGVALFPESPDESTADVLRQADTALHRAKQDGGDRVVFFENTMGEIARGRFQLEHELRHAIDHDELRLFLQPQVDMRGGIVAFEALVRWQHPERGLVPPGAFIAAAEESGLIAQIDGWVLADVCRLLSRLDGAGHPLRIAVNISPRHFREEDFVARVRRHLATSGADPSHLVLEVTEGLMIDDPAAVVGKMTVLTDMGIHFSIDDFGTGYSSLAYLKRLPIHELKIDRSFIQDAPTDPNDAALVETILAVASHLNLQVVAEGVETPEQARFLSDRGDVIQQGYLHGRPAPAEDWVARLGTQTSAP
jgi:diguanylate cyclase (GGDEF)-like protein/PAS domain S-box-containing protein